MKGKKCIGLLILCITFLLSLNLFSDANAVNFTQELNYVETLNLGPWTCHYYTSSDSTDRTVSDPCMLPEITGTGAGDVSRFLTYMTTRDSINVSKNKFYEIKILTSIEDYSDKVGGIDEIQTYPLNGLFYLPNSGGSADFVIKDVKILWQNTNTQSSYFVYNYGGNPQDNIPYSIQYYPQQVIEYDIIFSPNHDTQNVKLQLGRSGTYLFRFPASNITNYSPRIRIYPSPNIDIYEYAGKTSEEVAEKELEDRDNIESQSTTTDNQAENAGQSAESTGTTLFTAFSQFFTALTNVNGSSCVLPNMQVYSLNLGQMDLCTYDIPPQIMALVSIGMVFIIVPLGIHLVKRMLSLYKEITG